MVSRLKTHKDVLRNRGVREYLTRVREMWTYRVLFLINGGKAKDYAHKARKRRS